MDDPEAHPVAVAAVPDHTAPDAAVRALEAADRAAARAWVAEADALCVLWDTTPRPATRRGGVASGLDQVDRQVRAEAAWALGLHELSVGTRLGRALALRATPVLRTLMLSGRLGVAHGQVALDELDALGQDTPGLTVADQVVRTVLAPLAGPDADRPIPSQLVALMRRAAIAADPERAARLHEEQAARRTGVRLRAGTDGLADLVTTGRPCRPLPP